MLRKLSVCPKYTNARVNRIVSIEGQPRILDEQRDLEFPGGRWIF
jgi:hypothetical protein